MKMLSLLPLALYFIGAFSYTWTFHLRIVINRWSIEKDPGRRLYWLGLPGPTLAALVISIVSGKGDKLLESLFQWPVGLQWWLLAFLAVPATYIAATGIYALHARRRPTRLFHRPEQGWRSLLSSQLMVVGSEELGWRGFVLPILVAGFGSLGGTLILGPIWALWHLPMFRVSTSHQKGSFWKFVYVLTAWSIIMTATVVGSGGSILPAMLFHATANVAYFVMNVPSAAEQYSSIILGLISLVSILLLPVPLITLNP